MSRASAFAFWDLDKLDERMMAQPACVEACQLCRPLRQRVPLARRKARSFADQSAPFDRRKEEPGFQVGLHVNWRRLGGFALLGRDDDESANDVDIGHSAASIPTSQTRKTRR